MIIVNNLNNELITGSISGVSYSVTFDATKYQKMKDLEEKASKATTMDELKTIIEEFEPLTKESYKEVVETACPDIVVNKATNRFHLKYKGQVSSIPMPHDFADKIIKSLDKGIPATPLIKFWIRLLRNPKRTESKLKKITEYIMAPYTDPAKVSQLMKDEGLSHDVAIKKATTTQVGITVEGLIVGYKVSKEIRTKFALDEDENTVIKNRYKPTIDPDTGVITYEEPEHAEDRLFEPAVQGQRGDAFYCGDVLGHHIRVGKAHFLESWDQVNCNDDVSCVKGLHVGGLRYIHGYQNEGTVTHNVIIDPMHIGAVCGVHEGSDGAIRVKQYFVHSTMNMVNKNIYHSSTYAAMGDSEYQKMLEEVVEQTALKEEALAKFRLEAESLK